MAWILPRIFTLLLLSPLLGYSQDDALSFHRLMTSRPEETPPAQTPPQPKDVTPPQVEKQLSKAEDQYKKAKDMFNPWYTGPLVTPSASMMPPGSANFQPYLFISGAYATFNSHRHSVSLRNNLYSLQLLPSLLFGITKTMDCSVTAGAIINWQGHHTGGGYNDTRITVGFPITTETLYVPGMKFTVAELFPTGEYQHLNHNGLNLNGTGGGAYQTTFGWSLSKVIWWTYPYPMNLRFFIGYAISTAVHVKGFNTYGGGVGTNGTVHPGNQLTTDLGMEVSLTQKWVLALDVVYTATNRTKFHGNAGTTTPPSPAPGVVISASPTVGSGYSDNLSFAPAVEYNWNPNLGIIWGVQFSVYGRNSNNFATGQFSISYTF